MNQPKKILWILPQIIYPSDDGAKVAAKNLIANVSNQPNMTVDLLFIRGINEFFNEQDIPKDTKIFKIYSLIRKSHYHGIKKYISLFLDFLANPFFPITYRKFNQKKISDDLQSLIQKNKYDLIICEGLHSTLGLFNTNINFIYRAHNIEQNIWKTKYQETKNIFLKFIIYYQFLLVKRLENAIFLKANQIWTLSKIELEYITSNFNKNCYYIPVGMDFNHPIEKAEQSDQIKILFLGRLDWIPNKEGLLWFLRTIWPKVRENNFNLLIAGSGEHEWINEFLEDNKIKFFGRIEQIDTAYHLSDLVIVPIFIGGGTRIKVLEASSFAKPCLSTAIGISGSPLEQTTAYFSAETKDQWINFFGQLNRKELDRVGLNAFEVCKNELDNQVIIKRCLELISKYPQK